MNQSLGRRRFLGACSAAVACGALGACARRTDPRQAAAPPPTRPAAQEERPVAPERLYSISLAQWSLHRTLFAKEMDNLDFARRTREEFGLDAVEYVNTFFFDRVRDADYLAEMKRRADGAGVRSLLIMCDRLGEVGHPDTSKRVEAVRNHVPWMDAAAFLGCHSIRVNAASQGTYDEQQRLAADGLRKLAELGAQRGLNVIVENHGGLSSNGEWLAGVMRLVDHPNCGTLPDFGNFNISRDERYDRYKGVAEMMPFAKAVSAKSNDFDEQGNETGTDYRRMMRIVVDAGYDGYVGVEYEGTRLPEPAGIVATRDLLIRVREEMQAGR